MLVVLPDRRRISPRATPKSRWPRANRRSEAYEARRSGRKSLLATQLAETAVEHFAASHKEYQRQGNSRGVAECLIGMGAVSVQSWNADAARLFAAGQAMMDQSGSQIWPSNRADYDRYLSMAGDTLGRADFEAAWAEGGVMEPEQATALGLAVSASATPRGRSGGRS